MTALHYRDAGFAMIAARRYRIDGYDLDDLFQEACLAIWRADWTYDARLGNRAGYLIQAAEFHLLNLLRSNHLERRRRPAGMCSLQSIRFRNDDGDVEVGDLVEDRKADPALIAEQRDEIHRAITHPALAPGERLALVARAIGTLDGHRKSVITARRKIRLIPLDSTEGRLSPDPAPNERGPKSATASSSSSHPSS